MQVPFFAMAQIVFYRSKSFVSKCAKLPSAQKVKPPTDQSAGARKRRERYLHRQMLFGFSFDSLERQNAFGLTLWHDYLHCVKRHQ